MAQATLIKESIELGLAYSFRSLVHRYKNSKQADMVPD